VLDEIADDLGHLPRAFPPAAHGDVPRHRGEQRLEVGVEIPLRSLRQKFEEDLLRHIIRQPGPRREAQRQPLHEAVMGQYQLRGARFFRMGVGRVHIRVLPSSRAGAGNVTGKTH